MGGNQRTVGSAYSIALIQTLVPMLEPHYFEEHMNKTRGYLYLVLFMGFSVQVNELLRVHTYVHMYIILS